MSRREDQEHGNALVREVGSPGAFEAWKKREQALAQATTPEQLIDLSSKAAAVARYFKRSKRLLADQNEVAIYYLRCLRKLGGVLKEMGLRPGNPQWSPKGTIGKPATLKDIGLTKNASARYQRHHELPAALFNAHCKEMTAAGKLLTEASLLSLENRLTQEDAAHEKPWTIENGLKALHRLLFEVVARCRGAEDRDALTGMLGHWKTEIEQIPRTEEAPR